MTHLEMGRFISERRKFLNVTQQDLSSLSKVALRTIIDIENGQGNPSLSSILRVTETLGLSFAVYCQPSQK